MMVRLGEKRWGRRLDPAYRGGGEKKYGFLFLKNVRAPRLEVGKSTPLPSADKEKLCIALSYVW